LSGTDNRRGETEIETHLALEVRLRHGLSHPPGLGDIARQRFLNVKVLAGRCSVQHHSFVRVVGCADINYVHVRAVEQRAIVIRPDLASDLVCCPCRGLSVSRRHANDPKSVGGQTVMELQ
jgi:hypothetical protein